MSNNYYLAYGSNLNLQQMAKRCPQAKVVGKTILNNYKLLFRGNRESAVATVEPEKGSSVPVLVWEITPSDEVALDRYEGVPFLYHKEKVNVRLNDEQITAMVYIMNEGPDLGCPNCYYYNIILQGYLAAGFEVDILRRAAKGLM